MMHGFNASGEVFEVTSAIVLAHEFGHSTGRQDVAPFRGGADDDDLRGNPGTDYPARCERMLVPA